MNTEITAADEARADSLPGGPQQIHSGWVWYIDGREPFKAATRDALVRDVLRAVDRLGAQLALGE